MLRRAATQALARLSAAAARTTPSTPSAAPISTSARALADEPGAVPAGLDVFKEKWASVAPSTLNVPEFPSNFLEPEESAEPGAEDKFTVKVFTPTGTAAEGKMEQVTLPGIEGYFGVKRNHVPTIAQLKAGVVELHDGAEAKKLFVSGGFAFVHPNSVTDVCVLEAAPLDQFDPAAVKLALQAAGAAQGGDDFENAVNRAASELYSALDAALEAKA